MTFEEFFKKKRIDLALLRRAKPALYEEFRDHYTQMSEKSFDHTKKYWFNRLRKDFLLEVIETPKVSSGGNEVTAKPVEELPTNTMATKPAGVSSKSPSGFKPRFKSGVAASPAKKAVELPAPEEGGKPLGFKPRFKAGATPSVKQPDSNEEQPKSATTEPTPESSAEAKAKPLGFKPRFKAGKTDKKEE